MKQHITRAYNSFTIDTEKGIVYKTSEEQRLADEINFYFEINRNPNLAIYFPRLVNYSIAGNESAKHVLGLEYYAYDNIGDLMVYKKFDEILWNKIVKQLFTSLKFFSQETSPIIDQSIFPQMYIDKTKKYYNELIKNFPKFETISHLKTLEINNIKYLNFQYIWDDIEKIIYEKLLKTRHFTITHGDFCFSNILYGLNSKTDHVVLKYIDPRGNFGKQGIYGDPIYDHAKLMHSYEGGYEYIIFDQFDLKERFAWGEFEFSFINDNRNKIKKIFESYYKELDFDYDLFKLVEGLIFIGMCSRHYDSLERQTIMYLTGIKLLNEVLMNK